MRNPDGRGALTFKTHAQMLQAVRLSEVALYCKVCVRMCAPDLSQFDLRETQPIDESLRLIITAALRFFYSDLKSWYMRYYCA